MTLLNRDYECLMVLLKEKNITRAAQRLGMQQPGLSKILAKLEEEFGRKLFGRTKDGLIPTPFVEKLSLEIQKAQDQWTENYRNLMDQENRIEGSFKMGCHPVVASTYLPDFYTKLLHDYPELNLELILKSSVESVQMVVDGDLTFALAINPMYHGDLIIKPLTKDSVYLWAQETLKPGSAVYFNPEMIQISRILRSTKDLRLIPVGDYQVIYQMVLENPFQGAVLPESLVIDRKLKPQSKAYFSSDVCLVYRADAPKTAAVRTMTQRLTVALQKS